MLQAFIIVSREGLESFLIVAVILAFLRKTNRPTLLPMVYAGILSAVVISIGMGFVLGSVANQALWEGILGVVAAIAVGSLVIHMWRMGPAFKAQMEGQLGRSASHPSTWRGMLGVYLFTVFMITREGMETALMLFAVKNGRFIIGSFIGMGTAILLSWLWTRYSRFINIRLFFQVTGVFLLIFLVQTLVAAFHELCEAGIFAQSDHWHELTEPYSPDGMYGKWFSFLSVIGMGVWLVVVATMERFKKKSLTQI